MICCGVIFTGGLWISMCGEGTGWEEDGSGRFCLQVVEPKFTKRGRENIKQRTTTSLAIEVCYMLLGRRVLEDDAVASCDSSMRRRLAIKAQNEWRVGRARLSRPTNTTCSMRALHCISYACLSN